FSALPPPPPTPTLFPSTTLFRSGRRSTAEPRLARTAAARQRPSLGPVCIMCIPPPAPQNRRLIQRITGCHSLVNRGSRRSVAVLDRKSTRLNSSHSQISYAVFCL